MPDEVVLVLRAEAERAAALEILRRETDESSDEAAVWKVVREYPAVKARMRQAQREVRRLRGVLAELAEADPARVGAAGWREWILAEL